VTGTGIAAGFSPLTSTFGAALAAGAVAGFGAGAVLKKYCQPNSTNIIKANVSGKRFSKEGGSGGTDPGLVDIDSSH
jgi:hypothetical protein